MDIQGFLWLHTNFSIIESLSFKHAIGTLKGIALNLWISLARMDILTILVLPTHEHGISFHLFVSSSICFISVLQFLVYTFLVQFIPRYFILFC